MHNKDHVHLGDIVWQIPDPTAGFFAFVALLCTAVFGWYLVWKLKSQPLGFRLKLAVIFFVPALLATTYVTDGWDFSHEYKLMLVCSFIALQNILYWKSIKGLITPIGFYRSGLARCLDLIPDLVWMKDTEHRFIYTNKAVQKKSLLCSDEEAFGRTGVEIAADIKAKGMKYSFGDICAESDALALHCKHPSRFLESGVVDGEFLSLQVFKAPLLDDDGNVVGTIGLGRDLTYDCLDHEEIEQLLLSEDYEKAFEVFQEHKNRYKFDACK